METQKRAKPHNAFLILRTILHLIDLVEPTRRKHQLPILTRTNWKEAPTPSIYQHQLEGGYNPLFLSSSTDVVLQHLDYTYPTRRTLQFHRV